MDKLPQTYALFIGIDQYLPNTRPGNTQKYESLHGCVRDAVRMKEFLQHRLALPDTHMIMLLAPNTTPITSTELAVPHHQFPTYSAIVAAFQRITEMGQPGDMLFIYYAGHGARTASSVPEYKKTDEVLIPMDACSPQGRYLHDVELAYLLKKMGDAGLVVTLIIDSCFSGGTTRGLGNMTIRGTGSIDSDPPRSASLVASSQILAENWSHLPNGVLHRSHWFPATTAYVLLAACRATEQAYEYPLDSYNGHGVFTYWLLEAFEHMSPNATYQMVHARVLAQVHAQYERQTPLILGEAERLVFGSQTRHSEYAATVLKIDMEQRQLLLNVGEAHALVRKGAKFAIYPAEVTDFAQVERCLAIVEIVDLGGINSSARIVDILSPIWIEPGAKAVLRDPGTVRLQRSVQLFYNKDIPPAIPQREALSAVEDAIRRQHTNFVYVATKDEVTDYQIAINEEGFYEIWDPAGMLIETLHPILSISEPRAADKLVQRLIHLTKYRNIQQFENTDPFSLLTRKFQVTLKGKQAQYTMGQRPDPVPFDATTGNPTLKPGEWTFVCIKNASRWTLNITVFDLAPDWSITKVFPDDEAAHALDPGEEFIFELQADLPNGLTRATDTLKVFATLRSTDFQWLELPALDKLVHKRSTHDRVSGNPLEELLFALMQEAPATRDLRPGLHPGWEWTTAQLEIDVCSDY